MQCPARGGGEKLHIFSGSRFGLHPDEQEGMKTVDESPFMDTCRELLKMERGAFEMYTQALEFYRDDPLQAVLLSIRSAHDGNLDFLADQVGSSADGAGKAMDRFSGAVEGTSIVFGEGAALMALEAGENQLAEAYANAIGDARLPRYLRDDLRDRILPRVKANLMELEMARFS